MKKISITHLGNSHNEWLRSLDFYKGEIRILRDRLTEIAGKNTARETLQQVEHYENQLTLQAENIDTLSHEIRHNIGSISNQVEASSAHYIDAALFAEHNTLNEKFNAEEKAINNLRHDFNQFASNWM